MTPDPRQMRELAQAARHASDEQLIKLVSLLDHLPARGEADTLLHAARPRLRGRMPERPLNLSRLLFLPLDAVLTAPQTWRREAGRVPRTAILPLTTFLRATEPALVAEVEAALVGQGVRQVALCGTLGARLWPAAARLLGGERLPPPGWLEAGLPAETFAQIAATCTTLWRHGPGLWELRLAAGDGPPEAMVRPLFRTMAEEGAEIAGLGLSALLPFAARPAQLIATVAGLDRGLAPAADAALDRYLAGVAPPEGLVDLGATAEAVGRFVALMEDLDRSVTRDRPRRGQALQTLRAAAAAACAERIAFEADAGLMQPLTALLLAPAVPDAAVEALEARAAALRGLSEAGRRLQPTARQDPTFHAVLARLEQVAMRLPTHGNGFLQADALRLVQLLAGPEMAARLRGRL